MDQKKKFSSMQESDFLVEGPIDNPDSDLFGFTTAVDITLRFFADCPRPVHFAVYGRSGSGRSSFIKLLEHSLESNSDYVQLHFSARPFRRSKTLIRPLLRQIEKTLDIDDPAFESLKLTAASPPEPKLPEFDSWVDSIEAMQPELDRMITQGVNKKGKKALFLTVDDLDLCVAPLKLELIEFIAEFLQCSSVVLVITVDRKQLTSDYLNSSIFVAERQASLYLDRIFPHAYTIPWIGEAHLIDYVIDALDNLDLLKMECNKQNRIYMRFRRMVDVYLRRAAVTPIKIVRELIKFSRMHKLSTGKGVEIAQALFAVVLKSQFPEVYRFLLDKGERGLKDVKKVFDPDQDFSSAGFSVRYGRRLDRMLNDSSLRDLFVAYPFDQSNWPELLTYLNTAAFVPSPY